MIKARLKGRKMLRLTARLSRRRRHPKIKRRQKMQRKKRLGRHGHRSRR